MIDQPARGPLRKTEVVIAAAAMVFSWSCTAAFILVAVEVRAGRSLGLELGYLLLPAVPGWALPAFIAIGHGIEFRWRWPWLLYGAVAIGAPALVLSGGCGVIAEWWLA